MSSTIGIGTRTLRRVAATLFFGLIASTAMAQKPEGSATPLEGTYWRVTELAGRPTPTQDAKREAHLVFQAGGRVSGSDGCNRITGSYELKGDVVTFGKMAGTQMACIDIGDVDRAFREAMKSAARLTIIGDRLQLSDATGKPLAAFAARAEASPASTSSGLAGTSWQLVKFQGGDERHWRRTTLRNTRSNSPAADG